ncbi:uncharacterized protein UBRO_07508 [Ustilago bromivora]|uniref:GATA-type domain-containing protein n=1 Tax=Ustilago bromivora TaxID=307758 RepID=A0A1K0HJP4_9BASI|nr:uncharacterized protein UBRO_07508 [Ustilago bromivora]
MSSEAPAAPIAAHSVASSAPQAQFGFDILEKKPDGTTDPTLEQQSTQPEANAASEHTTSEHTTSEQDAAAVAAAAAADASSAAQTITELATAATNAANGPTHASTADAAAHQPEGTTGDAKANAEGQADAQQQQQQQDNAHASTSGLPRKVDSELREIYSVSSAIANFCVAHVNQVNVPTPQKVRNIIQKALKLTSSLSMLLAQPEVALRQLDADEHGKRPAESKLDSARKRQRSFDWDDNKICAGGMPMAPFTPNSGMRVFPDGSLPTSFPSPGMDGDMKGPQYKKRSRAPAPGSCQACATSETPEWRRGPDGARTLCNACGLHYAKLVRKRMQQEGGEEPSPSQAPPQISLVSLEELRASTKSAADAAAAGLTPSGSSSSLNGTPIKVNMNEPWNTPSKPPRVPSLLGAATVLAPQLQGQQAGEVNNNQQQQPPPSPPPPAPVGGEQQQTAGILEPAPAPTPAGSAQDALSEPVIAPELTGETGGLNQHAPMQTDQ